MIIDIYYILIMIVALPVSAKIGLMISNLFLSNNHQEIDNLLYPTPKSKI